MATQTVNQTDATAEALPALGDGSRLLGADASAEQRELLCLILDDEGKSEDERSLSGFARRGILMRVLALADVTTQLFEGIGDEQPYSIAASVHGEGSSAALAASAAIWADREGAQ